MAEIEMGARKMRRGGCMRLKNVVFFLLMFLSLSGFFFGNGDYIVKLDKNPGLEQGKDVIFKGLPIGKIISIELKSEKFVDVRISVEKEYQKYIRPNGVCYAHKKQLYYQIIDNAPKNISHLPIIKGFENKAEYIVWKGRLWAEQKIGKFKEMIDK